MKAHVYYNAKLNEVKEFDWFWQGFLSLTFGGLPEHVIYLGVL